MDYKLFKQFGLSDTCTSQQFDSRVREIFDYVDYLERVFYNMTGISVTEGAPRHLRPAWMQKPSCEDTDA